jgi:hypothetical protein
MILKLKNQLIKIDMSAERSDERRSIGLDSVLIEDAEQTGRLHSENVRSSSHWVNRKPKRRR